MTLRTDPFRTALFGSTTAHSVSAENLLFVGANGSGKSRLGAWFELNSGLQKVHPIAAQRALEIKTNVSLIGIDQAERTFLFGDPSWDTNQHKWRGNPTGKAASNYQGLLQYFFAENAQVAIDFKDKAAEVPSDRLLRIALGVPRASQSIPNARFCASTDRIS